MYKIAVLQFPGTNCEYEAQRAVNNSGMQGEFFRWNQNAEELDNYDGYVVAGGFSYEDRSRAGIIASLDPIMKKIKEEAEKGKPIIGICNGCQILMETGLVPGLENNALGGALALNTRAQDGKVIDTGYYNEQIYIKNQTENRSAFNLETDKNHHFRLPIAHGEGRFVLEEELLKELQEHNQIVFRYCDAQGEVKNEYPVNPNGTTDNIAGICNKRGNVLALMPHPERVAEGQFIFDSMKKYIEDNSKLSEADYKLEYSQEIKKPEAYSKPENSTELLVDMIITDNEAVTVENALKQSGFEGVEIKKKVYWNVEADNLDLDALVKSGELLNTNKENVIEKLEDGYFNLLVMYKGDDEGKGKLATLKNKLGFDSIEDVQKGILWQIKCKEEDLEKILATNIFYNPFSQDYFNYKFKYMNKEEIIKNNLKNTLTEINIPELGEKKIGKVRDTFFKDKQIILVTTDRQSAFDRVLAAIPFKGQVLNQTSAWWFKQVEDIIPNSVISTPDPNVVIQKKCQVFPFEVIVRGYLTGSTSTSAWTNYEKGVRNLCGNKLPDDMWKNQKFEKNIITPSTKFEEHDRNITPDDIINENFATREEWKYISQKALEVFTRGQKIAKEHGLILVDTKYEFGRDEEGNIMIIDEIHTPDSSRYWLANNYQENIDEGKEPDNIDKEFLRLWFKENCDPYQDEKLPPAPDELVIELSKRYIQLYEMITGEEFKFPEGDVEERIKNNLKNI